MSTLKVIFDFILSVVKVIFPGKGNGRHCRPDHTVPHTHRPDRPAPEGDGGGAGSSGGNPVDGTAGKEPGEEEQHAAQAASPLTNG